MRGQVIVIGTGIIGPCKEDLFRFRPRSYWAHLRRDDRRLITDLVTGQKPCVDPAPYRIDRF
jgi:hypothetical protein